MNFFGLIPHSFLGIDIGTYAIRLVEVSSWAGRKKLESYGEIPASVLYKKPFRDFNKSTLSFSNDDIARAIQAVIQEAGMKSKKVALSIPDFSTFFTNLELPPMTDREVPQAIKSEARRHIPLPLSEVTLDWQIMPFDPNIDKKKQKIKVLLAAVPNETINKYKSIVQKLNLEMIALEAEVFGLARSLISEEEKEAVALIDVGGRSTSCSIMYKGLLRVSYSFNVSGSGLIERLSKSLNINSEKSEKLMKQYGIMGEENNQEANQVKESLESPVSLMANEINDVCENFFSKEKKEVRKIIIGGGGALLPGLWQYFENKFPKKTVEIAHPFQQLHYPPILSEELKMMGAGYAVAIGMALKGLE